VSSHAVVILDNKADRRTNDVPANIAGHGRPSALPRLNHCSNCEQSAFYCMFNSAPASSLPGRHSLDRAFCSLKVDFSRRLPASFSGPILYTPYNPLHLQKQGVLSRKHARKQDGNKRTRTLNVSSIQGKIATELEQELRREHVRKICNKKEFSI
jgi:hypothetical protein